MKGKDYPDVGLLLLRLGLGLLMIPHGTRKLEKFFSGEPVTFADPIGIGEMPSLFLVIFAEIVCSILIILGIRVRLAVIPLIITMTVISAVVKSGEPLGERELPLLFLTGYFTLFFAGPGRYTPELWLKK